MKTETVAQIIRENNAKEDTLSIRCAFKEAEERIAEAVEALLLAERALASVSCMDGLRGMLCRSRHEKVRNQLHILEEYRDSIAQEGRRIANGPGVKKLARKIQRLAEFRRWMKDLTDNDFMAVTSEMEIPS